jgi:hypothetical protein
LFKFCPNDQREIHTHGYSKGNTYTASETLQAVANITKIVQNNQGGFTGTNKEIKTYYQDPAGVLLPL